MLQLQYPYACFHEGMNSIISLKIGNYKHMSIAFLINSQLFYI